MSILREREREQEFISTENYKLMVDVCTHKETSLEIRRGNSRILMYASSVSFRSGKTMFFVAAKEVKPVSNSHWYSPIPNLLRNTAASESKAYDKSLLSYVIEKRSFLLFELKNK